MSIKTLSEIITALAASAAAVAAWNGLTAWKKQLHGNTDHDIAWKYLEAVLKLRNAINKTVRNPLISIGESQASSEEYYGEDKFQSVLIVDPTASTTAVYAIRWNELMKARRELDNAIVQAEIWWGNKVVGLEESLNLCIGTLYVNVKNHIDSDRSLRADHEILYYAKEIETEYDKKLNEAIKKMEDFARPFLRESN